MINNKYKINYSALNSHPMALRMQKAFPIFPRVSQHQSITTDSDGSDWQWWQQDLSCMSWPHWRWAPCSCRAGHSLLREAQPAPSPAILGLNCK